MQSENFILINVRKSCDQCTIDLCKNNNKKGFAGWCLFGKRAVN